MKAMKKPLAAAYIPQSEPSVALPVVEVFLMLLAIVRAHLSQQITWGTRTTLTLMRRLRNPIFDAYFEMCAHIGSERTFVGILLYTLWTYDMTMARSMAMLYGLNVYVGSFLKNVFCLPRPMGEGQDYGWPSVLAMNSVSIPFFLLHCAYGEMWVWDSDRFFHTSLVYTGTLLFVGSLCATRLYFWSSSPADVQAGCILGAFLFRFWIYIASDVDAVVMSLGSWWQLPLMAIFLLLVHPVPSLVNLNETYKFCVSAMGFLSGFLLGCTMPAVLPYGKCKDANSCNIMVRTCVGIAVLQSFSLALDYSYPRIVENLVRLTLGRQTAVPLWGRKLLKLGGRFINTHASGFIAAWAIPRILEALEI